MYLELVTCLLAHSLEDLRACGNSVAALEQDRAEIMGRMAKLLQESVSAEVLQLLVDKQGYTKTHTDILRDWAHTAHHIYRLGKACATLGLDAKLDGLGGSNGR